MKENGRIVKNNCSGSHFDHFITKISTNKGLKLNNHKPATDEVCQERYSFSSPHGRVSIVLETNSGTLVMTAPDEVLRLLDSEFSSENTAGYTEVKPDAPKSNVAKANTTKTNTAKPNVAKPNAPNLNSNALKPDSKPKETKDKKQGTATQNNLTATPLYSGNSTISKDNNKKPAPTSNQTTKATPAQSNPKSDQNIKKEAAVTKKEAVSKQQNVAAKQQNAVSKQQNVAAKQQNAAAGQQNSAKTKIDPKNTGHVAVNTHSDSSQRDSHDNLSFGQSGFPFKSNPPFTQAINVRVPQQSKASPAAKNTTRELANTTTRAVANINANSANPAPNANPANKKPASSSNQAAKAITQSTTSTANAGKTINTATAKVTKDTAKNVAAEVADEQKLQEELYKNGFAIKDYQPDKLESFFKKLKSLKGVTTKQTDSGDSGRSFVISDGKNKVFLRYIDAKMTLQLQGKRSKLFGEVQVMISSGSDYVTAVSSHIDLTGEEKRAKDMEKRLKKLLPEGFDFLSEQAKIDITIGMMDIGNDEVKLSDYSMLLVPPYRGLERLIFDLQRAKSIEVKMIGQAYERDERGYQLKSGYRRKIGSIVYAEVMSALYTEYFARRNFYAHSDIMGDSLSRVITEKSVAKEIFANFVATIEYNIKKLKEIGFKL